MDDTGAERGCDARARRRGSLVGLGQEGWRLGLNSNAREMRELMQWRWGR